MLDAIYLLLTLVAFAALAALLGPLARFVDDGPAGHDETGVLGDADKEQGRGVR